MVVIGLVYSCVVTVMLHNVCEEKTVAYDLFHYKYFHYFY